MLITLNHIKPHKATYLRHGALGVLTPSLATTSQLSSNLIKLVYSGFLTTLNRTTSDTIKERSNSDFDVKYATIQFYSNNHNSQSDHLDLL